MYRILVLEDDCIQRRTLSEIIRQCSDQYQVYDAASVREALAAAQKERMDLFYVDINVNKESGLKFADEIRKMECYRLTWIIFVTIYKEYMLPAFKRIHCYDYIVKPYKAEDIQRVTRLLLAGSREEAAASQDRGRFIIVPVKNIQVKIYTSEILFVEVYIRTSIIHTLNGSFTIDYLSLKRLKSMIRDENILQSHRSYLINIRHISRIEITSDKTSCRIYFYNTDKTALLGQSYKKNILDRFNNGSGWDENE